MENEEKDFLLAQRLQKQFDLETLEISSGEEDVLIIDSIERDHQMALRLQEQYTTEAVELFSDSDDDVILQATETETATNPKIATRRKSSTTERLFFDGSMAESKLFKAEAKDLNCNEYFIEELQVYVNPEYNFEWKFIDVLPDIAAIFAKFDALYFQSRFKNKKMTILWSNSMGNSCTNRNFNDDEGRYTIALNGPLLTLRPRIEIISIILHEMIHALLKMAGVQEPNSGHGANFRKIMTFLNSMLQTNISFNHKLYNTSLVCRNQWYRCTGICHNYEPFYGIVRSIDGPPGLQNEWWKTHADNCGGTFYKIYEMSKMVSGEVSTRYAVNVKYMLPKRENIRCRYKSTLVPEESIDLTSGAPKVISTTILDTVNVDTEDSGEAPVDTTIADTFIQQFERSIAFTRDACDMLCPICQERIKRKLFGNHIDGCKGFVRVVQWKKSANGTIVQNGLMELKSTPGLEHHASAARRPRHFSDSAMPSSSSFANYQQAKRKRFG
uniref:SprT-like domain-containing protein n=1 Tax=Anopheles culicifacies TaxID=139723 RepID=A0A182MNS3_9DIPT